MRRLFFLTWLLLCVSSRSAMADGCVVQAGDTLTRLAARYNVTVDALRAANPSVDERHLVVGAQLVLPATSYTVIAGDTLFSVGRRTSVSVDDLRKANGLSTDALEPGQTLSIPAAPSPSPPPPLPSPATWLQVKLADGSTAWAPRDSLLQAAPAPLTPPQLVALARRLAGVPYQWGGTTPNGVDCSGFVQTIYNLAGYSLPRTADVQFNATHEVPTDQLQPGDLVFFTTYIPGPSHVGIYVGDGHFIHASSSKGVTESALSDPYYASRFLGGRRLTQWMTSP